jgi:hypothetical protein
LLLSAKDLLFPATFGAGYPGRAATAGGLSDSVNSAGAAGLVLGSVGVDSQDIQVYCRI